MATLPTYKKCSHSPVASTLISHTPPGKRPKTLTRLHIDVLPLLAHEVHDGGNRADDETDGAAPPDDGEPDEVVLDLVVAPAAHAQADAEERPVGRLRREDVLLVRVRDERVVRGGHRDVEVPEVAEERRLVQLHLARGN